MSAEILNLDDFETEIEKTVIHEGVKHAFQPFSVEDFIKNLKQIENFAKLDEIDVSEYMEHMVDMVVRAFPSMGEETVRALPMTKLKKLNEFIRGQTEYEAADGLEQTGAEVPKN